MTNAARRSLKISRNFTTIIDALGKSSFATLGAGFTHLERVDRSVLMAEKSVQDTIAVGKIAGNLSESVDRLRTCSFTGTIARTRDIDFDERARNRKCPRREGRSQSG
jgi:hypothetical protein